MPWLKFLGLSLLPLTERPAQNSCSIHGGTGHFESEALAQISLSPSLSNKMKINSQIYSVEASLTPDWLDHQHTFEEHMKISS